MSLGRFAMSDRIVKLALVLGLTISVLYVLGDVFFSVAGSSLPAWFALTAQIVLSVLAAGALSFSLLEPNLRALARQTFITALRSRLAVGFAVILAILLAALPTMMQGDGTLAGRVRTFLVYSTAAVASMLGLITILLSARIVTADIAGKQIFLLAVKPLARWQYLLGRWMGLMAFNLLLLVLAGGAIYGLGQHLRAKKDLPEASGGAVNPNDYRVVEAEIFTARSKALPQTLDLEAAIQDRIRRLREEGHPVHGTRYDDALNSYRAKANGNEEEALRLLVEELRKQVSAEMQSVPPGAARPLSWTFTEIDFQDRARRGKATLADINPRARALRLQADRGLTAHLVHDSPVLINGMQGRVFAASRRGEFLVTLSESDFTSNAVQALKIAQEVDLSIEPLVQFSYKATVGSETPDRMIRGIWVFTNPQTGYEYQDARTDSYQGAVTVTVPAKVLDSKGTVRVDFFNRSPTSVSILHSDVSLLHRTGSFEMNFARALGMVLLQLAFLAALGLVAGSLVSFPVACMLCFSILPYMLARVFLEQATQMGAEGGFMLVSRGLLRLMAVLVPDLGSLLPGEQLVGGLVIPWADLARAAVGTLIVRASLVLALGCALFSRRELARVQV